MTPYSLFESNTSMYYHYCFSSQMHHHQTHPQRVCRIHSCTILSVWMLVRKVESLLMLRIRQHRREQLESQLRSFNWRRDTCISPLLLAYKIFLRPKVEALFTMELLLSVVYQLLLLEQEGPPLWNRWTGRLMRLACMKSAKARLLSRLKAPKVYLGG